MTWFIVAIFLAIWVVGHYRAVPHSLRWAIMAVIICAIIALHYIFPDTHAVRVATRGTARDWIVLLVLGLVVAGYRVGLRKIRARVANAQPTPGPVGTFGQGELTRYARHIVLREIGGPGQKRLKQAKVLVIGAGGLGAPVLMYLAAAGVGRLGVVDDDVVDESNLQRQIIHTTATQGRAKVTSAAQSIQALNPYVDVRAYNTRITADNAADMLAEYDVVVDGSDNFATRYQVNAAAARAGKPLVSGALSQWEGQVSVFDPAQGTPCYQCIFPQPPDPDLAPNCAAAGVFAPLPGIIGSIMGAEVAKIITGAGTPLRGRLMLYDALDATSRTVRISPRGDCPVCGG